MSVESMTKVRAASLATAITISLPFQVQAAAIFNADAQATLTLTSVTGPAGDFTSEASATVFDSDLDAMGGAISGLSSTSLPVNPTSLSDAPLVLNSSVSGDASTPGSAFAFVFNEGFVTLDNMSDVDTVEFEFRLDYSASVNAMVDEALLEFATASAFITVDDGANLVLDFALTADTDAGLADSPVTDTFTFSVSVAPLSFTQLSLMVDADGNLTSDLTPPPPPTSVSSPATILLFGAGLGVLCLQRAGSPRRCLLTIK